MAPVLEFENIVRGFGSGAPVLNGVSFSVQPEEVVALLGRNGVGKTTLVNIAMGMLFPQRGRVSVFGMSPTEEPVAVKRRIGFVGEQQILPPRATIAELIALHRKLFPSWDGKLEKQLLERFELAGNSKKISQLSKGQVQHVALLCAVCHRPELLLLDEPAAGLDPVARREFLETSIQLLNSEGTAILFSSHHMGDVERLGGRAILLDGGTVRLDRSLDDLREQHCIAIFAKDGVPDVNAVKTVEGCLHVRAVRDSWHAVFAGSPHAVQVMVQRELGIVDVQCVAVPLEELFVEMVGGDRPVNA